MDIRHLLPTGKQQPANSGTPDPTADPTGTSLTTDMQNAAAQVPTDTATIGGVQTQSTGMSPQPGNLDATKMFANEDGDQAKLNFKPGAAKDKMAPGDTDWEGQVSQALNTMPV